MILAIDIGNTNIVIGGFSGDVLEFVARINTDPQKTEDEYAGTIKSVLSIHNVDKSNVKGAIISSVVPPLNTVMKKAIDFIYGIEPLMVSPGIKTGIKIQCDSPQSVGADLICACVAAHHIYGSPSLIIDMGTATKMMILDQSGAFIGVTIAPGVDISLKALTGGTAQLPQIDLSAPPVLMGKNTMECMRSGVIFGNASMLDGMIDRFEKEMGTTLTLVATGGLSNRIIPHCNHKITIDDSLVLEGLRLLYIKNTAN